MEEKSHKDTVEKQTTTTLSYVLTKSILLQKTFKTKWKTILQTHSWIVTTLRKSFRSQENSTVSKLKQKHLHMYRRFDLKLVYHLGNFSNHVELNISRSLLLYLPSELGHKLVIWKKQLLLIIFQLHLTNVCVFFFMMLLATRGWILPMINTIEKKKCCSRV